MSLPLLETERLNLRPFRGEDVDDLHHLWTNREVRRHLWDDVVISRELAASVVASSLESAEAHGIGMWSLLLRSRLVHLIGFCGFRFLPDSPDIEILYGLSPGYWKRGLATEACRAAIAYAFGLPGVERVFAGANAPNRASFRVMERLGMEPYPEGIPGVPGAVYDKIDRPAFTAGSPRTA